MKLVKSPTQIGALAAAGNDLVRHGVDILQSVAAQVLQFKLKAAEASQALNGRRFEGHHDGSGNPKQFWRDARHNIAGRVPFAFALVDGLQRGKDQSVVGRTPAGKREAGNRKCTENIGIGPQNLFRLPGDLGRVGERRALRRLHHHDEVVLIFLRHEPGGNVNVHVAGGGQAGQKQHDHGVTIIQDLADGFAVSPSHGVDRVVNSMRDLSVAAREPADVRPIEHGILVFFAAQQEVPPGPARASAR